MYSLICELKLICFIYRKTKQQRSKNYQPCKQVPSVDCNRLQQTKRVLFQSPSNKHKKISSASKCRSVPKKNKSDIDRTTFQNSEHALWPSTSKDIAIKKEGHDRALTNLSGQINVYGKRRRDESGMPTQPNKCPRRMLFGDVTEVRGKSDFMAAGDKSQRVRIGENRPQVSSVSRDLTGGLSEVHRKVSFWTALALLVWSVGVFSSTS